MRVRPLLQSEIEDDHTCEKLSAESDTSIAVVNRHGKPQRFKFDSVFDVSKSQESIFRQTRVPFLVEQVMNGFHATIFAYGQTGSGKTYTMDGLVDGHASDEGVIPRAISELFT